jgi:cell division protein FtsI/penicillin-binding protein 2
MANTVKSPVQQQRAGTGTRPNNRPTLYRATPTVNRSGAKARRDSRARDVSTAASHRGYERHSIVIQPWRQVALLVTIIALTSGLTFRLIFWQVIDRSQLITVAAAEHSDITHLPPARGLILDANGDQLAADSRVYAIYAAPRQIARPGYEAQLLSQLLSIPVAHLQTVLASDVLWSQLATNVPESTAKKIGALGLDGIVLEPVPQRVYPEGELAAQVLGFVNDNGGQYGVEGYYDRLLSGHAGIRSILRDTAGNRITVSSNPSQPAQQGATLYLSIDSYVQSLAEEELQRAVTKHKADGGTIIVMDPHTGYILALANNPSFDPNHYGNYPAANWLNPAISDTYEPGSTFKIITMAAALDSHLITPQTAFEDTGAYQVTNDVTIHNWNMQGNGWETMTQVLQHSANVGAAWVANLLGTQRFYKYVRAFGFGAPTGIDLQGEVPGTLYLPGNPNWNIVNLYTNSFGQGIAVTPLQLITAVSAVANGGWLMRPQVVTRIDYQGHTIFHPPVRVRRVISSQTAATLTHMLVESAIGGEAQHGLVYGYNIAAKTGTSNVAGPNGHYIPGDTIASIIGYAPAEHPRFIALVIIRHPRDTPWGSLAAAPVLHDLCEALFLHYHIPPSA